MERDRKINKINKLLTKLESKEKDEELLDLYKKLTDVIDNYYKEKGYVIYRPYRMLTRTK